MITARMNSCVYDLLYLSYMYYMAIKTYSMSMAMSILGARIHQQPCHCSDTAVLAKYKDESQLHGEIAARSISSDNSKYKSRDFTRCYEKTSLRILRRDPGLLWCYNPTTVPVSIKQSWNVCGITLEQANHTISPVPLQTTLWLSANPSHIFKNYVTNLCNMYLNLERKYQGVDDIAAMKEYVLKLI